MRLGAWFDVKEKSAVMEARRRTRAVALDLGLDASDAERAAIVTTEVATNMVRHAGGGRLLVSPAAWAGPRTLAIVAIDKGNGIENIDRMMTDGVSTGGSAGIGLGAIERQSDDLDILTRAGEGTIITAQIRARGEAYTARPLDVAVLTLNHPGQAVCGDGWSVRPRGSATDILVCDGLGHGPEAMRAAEGAMAAFERGEGSPQVLLARVSEAITDTRGAVAMAAAVDNEGETLTYAGVGNISGLVCAVRTPIRRLASRDGRLGAPQRSSVHEETVAFGAGDVLILHSDGVRTLRNLADRPELMFRRPLTIAAAIIGEYERGSDDACIMVAKRAAQKTAGD
ncbi:SpoIIE family protein phosphatase [Acuticoccus sp. MNP-M23]|uniref:SpoIIE family protein phosphatase n=1 Tax=Acuticoccus sp. MNP-M23 TaxID=3072793 RepID=UPI002814CF3D|nr:SpoIIE family protein phosphatase [Acuticoccus sp. MNP-M23]WMS43083.1 SpoIIE family protein phosphatase [Acuticoccus sp. MNP-M23]